MDLFDDDKRLALSPVVKFNALIKKAFADGGCTCNRCKENGGSQDGYEFLHTFEVDGQKVARQFIQTMPSEVLVAVSKAYKAFYKVDLPPITEASLGEIQALATQQNVKKVQLLLEVTGLLGGPGLRLEAESELDEDQGYEIEAKEEDNEPA